MVYSTGQNTRRGVMPMFVVLVNARSPSVRLSGWERLWIALNTLSGDHLTRSKTEWWMIPKMQGEVPTISVLRPLVMFVRATAEDQNQQQVLEVLFLIEKMAAKQVDVGFAAKVFQATTHWAHCQQGAGRTNSSQVGSYYWYRQQPWLTNLLKVKHCRRWMLARSLATLVWLWRESKCYLFLRMIANRLLEPTLSSFPSLKWQMCWCRMWKISPQQQEVLWRGQSSARWPFP